MNNIKSINSYFLLILIVIFALSFVMLNAFILITPSITFADTLVQDSILNFNQLINITSVGNTLSKNNSYSFRTGPNSTTSLDVNISGFNFIADHKYYIKTNYFEKNNSNAYIHLYNTNTNVGFINITHNQILSNLSNYLGRLYFQNDNGGSKDVYINIIDLTQMYGAGKEPTYSEIKNNNIFPTYYNYTLNLPVSLNTYTEYLNGYTDALAGLETTIVANNVYNNAYPVNYGSVNFSYLRRLIEDGRYVVMFNGYIGINLSQIMPAGSNINVKASMMNILNSNIPVNIAQITNSGIYDLTTLYPANKANDGYVYSSFSLASATDTLIFYSPYYLDTPDETDIIIDLEFSYKSINVYDIIQNTTSDAIEYYQKGNPGYNIIYNEGYDAGSRSSGIDSAWSFVSTSFTGLGNIFSIEFIPGVPLWVFIAIPLLFGLIVFLYKLSGGA